MGHRAEGEAAAQGRRRHPPSSRTSTRHLPTPTSTTTATHLEHHRLTRLPTTTTWPRMLATARHTTTCRSRCFANTHGTLCRIALPGSNDSPPVLRLRRVYSAYEPIFYKQCGPPTTTQGVEQRRYHPQMGILSTRAGQVGWSRLHSSRLLPGASLG